MVNEDAERAAREWHGHRLSVVLSLCHRLTYSSLSCPSPCYLKNQQHFWTSHIQLVHRLIRHRRHARPHHCTWPVCSEDEAHRTINFWLGRCLCCCHCRKRWKKLQRIIRSRKGIEGWDVLVPGLVYARAWRKFEEQGVGTSDGWWPVAVGWWLTMMAADGIVDHGWAFYSLVEYPSCCVMLWFMVGGHWEWSHRHRHHALASASFSSLYFIDLR